MPLTVRDIIENNFFPGTELITGRESAGNIVSWVNVQEILDSVDMVGSGELLITTGFDLADYTRYFNLIKRLKGRCRAYGTDRLLCGQYTCIHIGVGKKI